MIYPFTKQDSTVDQYFSHNIADPYRWLENDTSAETEAWVTEQNTVTFDTLSHIDNRDAIRNVIAIGQDYQKTSQPFKRGDYTYFYQNDGLQNQSVVYRSKEGGAVEVFLDPNTFSEEGTTSLGSVSFSKDTSLVAYSISEAGSDWRKIFVLNTETKEQVEAPIVDAKFTGISWLGNKGFYYSSYDKPTGSELSARTDQHKLYYHEVGKPQSDDVIVFGATEEEKHRYVSGYTTEDDAYLVISAATSTSGNKLFIERLDVNNPTRITVLAHTDSDTYVIENEDSRLLMFTNLEAPNGKIVSYNAVTSEWIDVISEQPQPLEISVGGGTLFASYMVDVLSQVKQYDFSGNLLREIELPGEGQVSGFSGKREQTNLFFTFTNYVTPPTIYQCDANTGEVELYLASESPFDSEGFESTQVFYTSKDGTRIPMIISHKKGIALDGKNPTILYGYGGFNVSLTPSFSGMMASWLELGGVYAVPNIRGGGEYGKAWHNAGTQQKKQDVFDDFIAAAECLIEMGYTDSEHLALRGGSNGGLLVGACMTQRPELFKVALPAVGVLDMLRYHTFTSGEGWAYDFGTSEQSEEMFHYLLNYSPVHNVKEGVEYPATLVTTADHDDRVVPAHSYKFIAELQKKQTGENPVLIRIDVNAGHGAGMPISKSIDLMADIYAFTLANMKVDPFA
ncbi:prolyl oligopeptidase family serine peptidase [Aliivibrio logei]|uniref:prolyl oligopeptidase n=1 Tax=Aliivibrio logei 5S-186 TaxID=626086 RepID=A0ABX3AXM4_ALILO|nr:prolyl oligopeptidase family serine peptidase [Aliivibrio logei]OEF19479.1 prolyl endopeptidase [Aliivibrio logei 5S-186]